MKIHPAGLYLDRIGRRVGIVRDRGAGQHWRWITTRGYYVSEAGRATLCGEVREDLVADITQEQKK